MQQVLPTEVQTMLLHESQDYKNTYLTVTLKWLVAICMQRSASYHTSTVRHAYAQIVWLVTTWALFAICMQTSAGYYVSIVRHLYAYIEITNARIWKGRVTHSFWWTRSRTLCAFTASVQTVAVRTLKNCSHTKKTVRTLKKKEREEENSSLQREPTWQHKALSGSHSILYATCTQSYGKPPKTEAYHHRSD